MKKALISLYFTFIILSFSAQNLISHQSTLGGGDSNSPVSAINTPDNGYLLFSNVRPDVNMGDVTSVSYGGSFIWVVKFDENHNSLWQNSYGGDQFDGTNKVIDVGDGIIMGGSSDSPASGNKTTDQIGGIDIWIVKIDYDGNILYQYSYGGSETDMLADLIELQDGNYFILARSNSPASDDKSEDSYGEYDYWGIKINPQGQILWEKTYGSDDWDLPYNVVQLNNGDLVLAGSSLGSTSGLKTEDSFGDLDYWCVKVNHATGDVVWDKTYGGNSPDEPRAMVTDGDNIYIAGNSHSSISGLRTVELKGSIDSWFLKLDNQGTVVFDMSFGGDAIDMMRHMQIENNQIVMTLGSSSSISGNKTEESRGAGDYWFVRIDFFGNIEKQKTIGGSDSDFTVGNLIRTNGNYLLYGNSKSGISGDRTAPKIYSDFSGYDMWLVELDAVTLSIKSSSKLSYNAFPNPFSESVTLEIPQDLNVQEIYIHDISGKMLKTISNPQIDVNQIILDLSGFQSGVYFLHFLVNDKTEVLRLVKE